MNSIRSLGWPARSSHKVALGVALVFASVLFVVGSFYSGWFFVSHAAVRLPASITPVIPGLAGTEPRIVSTPVSVPGGAAGEAAGVPAKQASDPRFAFLLLGYGGGGHDGGLLTDSMMVVIADPEKKTLTMMSLPRDAWVPQVFNGQTANYYKINTTYAFGKDASLYPDRLPRYKGPQGAGNLVSDTVSRLLGIPVSYYVALDFAGFRQMIDLVGGIDVDIPASFTANYPANDDPSIDPSWIVVSFRKGTEHMGGERAIEYARARETIDNLAEGSDFARSRRQQLIVEAFKSKLMSAGGIVRIPQLLGVAATHVDTNYSVPSAAQIGQMAADWKNVRFYQAALTNENYLTVATGPQGMYILVPDAQDYSWSNVRALSKRLWDDPEVGAQMAKTEITVENDTGVAGVGGKVAEVLSKMGYRVGTPTTGTTRPASRVVDRTGGEASPLIRQLGADLKVKLDEATADKATGGILLQVGSADVAMASLTVPADPSAPSSKVGIIQSGTWSPEPEPPEPTAEPTRAPTSTTRTPTTFSTVVPRRVLPDGSVEPDPTSGPAGPVPTLRAPNTLPPASPTTHPVTATPAARPPALTPTPHPPAPSPTPRH